MATAQRENYESQVLYCRTCDKETPHTINEKWVATSFFPLPSLLDYECAICKTSQEKGLKRTSNPNLGLANSLRKAIAQELA